MPSEPCPNAQFHQSWHTEDATRTETMTPHEEFETWAKDYRKRNNLIHLIGAWDAWAAGAASWKQRAEQFERAWKECHLEYYEAAVLVARLRTLLEAADKVIDASRHTRHLPWTSKTLANYDKLKEGK